MWPRFCILGCILWVMTPFNIFVYALPESSVQNNTVQAHEESGPKPFYGIAHRVLTTYGVHDAIKHGANAIEIDLQAWSDGWYADHDGTSTSAGDTAERMFHAVAAHRRAGWNIIFVWMDIKNPDYCGQYLCLCNVERLRTLARSILQPVGVRVLYGFSSHDGRGYQAIRDSLNDNEAIGLEGYVDDVRRSFEEGGPADVRKRVFTKGYFIPAFQLGDCVGYGDGICPEIQRAIESRAFGQVFGWTISSDEDHAGELLMKYTQVDGLIYGFIHTHYYDDNDTLYPLSFLYQWILRNPWSRYYATIQDNPW